MDLTNAAKILGAKGGARNTKAQNDARKRNGKLGGRPKLIRKDTDKIVVDNPERSD